MNILSSGIACGLLSSLLACLAAPDVVIPRQQEEPTAQDLLRGFEVIPKGDSCYDFVGEVISPEGKFIGSCVLIDPDILLTAAHCVISDWGKFDADNPTIDKDTVLFRFGEDIVGAKSIMVSPYLSATKWNEFTGTQVIGDFAIVKLEREVRTTALPIMNTSPWTISTYEPVSMVGFGHMIKKHTKHDEFYCSGITHDSPYNIPIYPQFAMIWFGDSGGPLFDMHGNLSGIIYRFVVTTENSHLVEFSAVNTGYYYPWIRLMREKMKRDG